MSIYYPKCVCSFRPLLNDYGIQNFTQPKPFIAQPISANIRINNYSEANTFNVTLRWEDFPFDPRILKNALVSVSIFDLKKLKDQSNFNLDQVRRNAVVLGFVDQYGIELDASTRQVNMEGRDYTSIFLETKFDNANLENEQGKRNRKISLSRSLRDIIKDLMKNVPGSGGITIEDRTTRGITNVAAAAPGFSLLTGQMSSDGMNTYVQQQENYWDVIQNLCEQVGVICYIELDKLILTNPRVLYSGEGFSNKKSIPFIYGQKHCPTGI